MASSTFTTLAPLESSLTTINAHKFKKRSIEADLNYWKNVENQQKFVDFTGPDAAKVHEEIAKLIDSHKVLIHDIRGEESTFSLDKNGFQYVQHDVPELEDWLDEKRVTEILIPATEKLVAQITGAAKVVTFANRIRCFASDDAKHAQNRAPAHNVHSDFTVTGALHHLRNIIKDPAEVDELLRGRVYIINVWRPLRTIDKDPLAVCDWTSVDPKKDWIAYRITHGGGWNELGQQTFSDKHRWYYLGKQKPSEPLVFKQYDSKDETGCTLAHSAFVDSEYVNCPPRESIEIKMFAFVLEEVASSSRT